MGARPGFDAYWYFRDAVFDAILPSPHGLTLEVGCGEGRVTRDLVARGHDVVALDPAPTLVRAAAEEDPVHRYAIADGLCLPFPEDRFGVVVTYNVLQNVADLPGAVQEMSRVLRPGGALCVCVVHPVTDLGGFEPGSDGGRFFLRERYYDVRRIEETEERDGISMTFRGWTYPLEAYVARVRVGGVAHRRAARTASERPPRAVRPLARGAPVPRPPPDQAMMRKQYSLRRSAGGFDAWDVDRLVELATGLPVREVAVADIAELDEEYWFADSEVPATVRAVVEHARLIAEVDLAHPIILDVHGRVMDGMHRVARALLDGRATLPAVRFEVQPPPDFVDCRPSELPYDE